MSRSDNRSPRGAERLDFLQELSRRPHACPHATPAVLTARLLAARRCHPARARGRRAHGVVLHSLKAELIHGPHFATDAALRAALRRSVPHYNRRRLHSALGYRTRVDYESAAAQHCLRN